MVNVKPVDGVNAKLVRLGTNERLSFAKIDEVL